MREKYINIRPFIFLGSEQMIPFLQEWCAEEKRDFNILMHIFHAANQHGFLHDLLQRLVYYMDKKFNINKLYYVDSKEIIKIF